MKLQIDTKDKTIRIEEATNLGEFIKTLDGLFPKEAWKEYKLEISTIHNWTSPIIIERDRWYPTYPWTPSYPTYPGYITWGMSSIDCTSDSNTYNVEVNAIDSTNYESATPNTC